MGSSMSQEWNDIHDNREWGKYPGEQVIRFVARNYYKTKRENVRILDFGCGQGAHTWFLAREGFDTYAFDGAASAVEKTRKWLDNEGLKATVDVMDGTNTTYQDGFFDAVIDSACIGHNKVSDIVGMYQDTFRMLKDGGRLYSSFFNTNTTGFGTGELIEKNTYKNVEKGPLEGLGVVHFWEKDELRDLISDCGFKDILIEKDMHTDRGSVIDIFVLTAVK